MKRIARIAVVAAVVLVAAVGAFLSAGGVQVIRFLRGPDLPPTLAEGTPSTDIAYLREAVLRNERGAVPEQYARFLSVLDESPSPRTIDEFTLIASRALAQFDNAHTSLSRPLARRLPIRLHWVADGLIIVKARPEHAGQVGRRVLTLGGRTPEELLARIPQLVGGGTESWRRYRSSYFFTVPIALAFLGAQTADGAVVLRTQDVDGAEETVVLTADLEPMPGAPFWDFRDSLPGDTLYGTEGWTTMLRPDQDLPFYQQEPQRLFLIREAPDHDAVYLRVNGSLDDEESNETVRQFTERALAAVRPHKNIIVDFRRNRGGDYTMVLPLVRGVADAVPADGRVYLVTGPSTFSAGIVAGSQFKRFVPDRLTVVGEEVGDRMRFRAEGFVVTLPATGNRAFLAGAWDYLDQDCGWFDDCWMPNKLFLRGIGSLDPDIRVANTWASYRERRDLVVEAVFADIARREAARKSAD